MLNNKCHFRCSKSTNQFSQVGSDVSQNPKFCSLPVHCSLFFFLGTPLICIYRISYYMIIICFNPHQFSINLSNCRWCPFRNHSVGWTGTIWPLAGTTESCTNCNTVYSTRWWSKAIHPVVKDMPISPAYVE